MTSPNNHTLVLRDLESHIPTVPMSSNDIAKRVGLWSEKSISLALLELWKLGKVRRCADDEQPPSGRAVRNLYWRDAG